MDLKVVSVIVCLCALAITSTEAGIPKCCIRTKKDIPLDVLLRVQRVEMQHASGACDIAALILHVKNSSQPICAHLKVKRTLRKLHIKMRQIRQKKSI